MASGGDIFEGKSFFFNPEEEDSQEFLKTIENPSENVCNEVIQDVVTEIQPALEEDGIPPAVLELLQKLWLGKLEKAQAEQDNSFSSDSSFHGFPEKTLEETPLAQPPQPASISVSSKSKLLGAIPKNRSKKPKILQVDGPNDSSDSDENISNDDVDDDDDNGVVHQIISSISNSESSNFFNEYLHAIWSYKHYGKCFSTSCAYIFPKF